MWVWTSMVTRREYLTSSRLDSAPPGGQHATRPPTTRPPGGATASTQMPEPRLELEQHLHTYRQMAKIRAFEEQVNELYKGAKMPGLAHLYVGEEAVAVGVCGALKGGGVLQSTHRGRG